MENENWLRRFKAAVQGSDGAVSALTALAADLEVEEPDQVWWQLDQTLGALALTLEEHGRIDEALAVHERKLKEQRAWYAQFGHGLADTLGFTALCLLKASKVSEARALAKEWLSLPVRFRQPSNAMFKELESLGETPPQDEV